MHGNINNALQNCEDFVLRLLPLFVLNVFIPERMSKEVKSYTSSGSLKQSSAQDQYLLSWRVWGARGG